MLLPAALGCNLDSNVIQTFFMSIEHAKWRKRELRERDKEMEDIDFGWEEQVMALRTERYWDLGLRSWRSGSWDSWTGQ
jgi:hypothetical protein